MHKPKVLLGLPTMGQIHTFLCVTIMSWLTQAQQNGDINISIYPTMSVQPVDNARNEIVQEFLKSDCTHLFFIDSDTIPPPDAIHKLLAMDKDIATGLTPIIEAGEKEFYRKWNCVGMDDLHLEPNTGMKQCKGAGSSCILIKRHVFENMKKPWYRFLYSDDTGKEVLVSEDIHFVIKALGKGIETWCDTSIICGHNKTTIW